MDTLPNPCRTALNKLFPGCRLGSCEPLEGGATNRNHLLQFEDRNDAVVLRIYARGRATCEKELRLWELIGRTLPVPEMVYADPSAEDPGPFVIYRFAEGVTFQQLKKAGNLEDMAGAAFAIGESLGSVGAICGADIAQEKRVSAFDFDPLLEQRIGACQADRVRGALSRWQPRLDMLDEQRSLVHGDFNNRNTIVKRKDDGWIVSAILDWELAFAGSPLWDVARFVCYEHPDRPCREPFFSTGYREGGGELPADWPQLERLLNLASAARGLADPELRSAFVLELRDLIGELLGCVCEPGPWY